MGFANLREVLHTGGGTFTPAVFASQELREVICSALDASDTWHKRHCSLRAPLVLSTVLAMSLFRSSSIVNVFKRVLDAARGHEAVRLGEITPEALYKARARLGAEPLRHVALAIGAQLDAQGSFLGLIPCAIDGVSLNLPDTPENEAEFGRPKASRGETAFPQMKGVALVYTDTHTFIDCRWGRWDLCELNGAESLIKRLDSRHVVFLDRRYTKCALWFSAMDQGVHFIHRLSASCKPKVIKRLAPGDSWVEVGRWVQLPLEPGKSNHKRVWVARLLRLIEYQIGSRERVQLLTDLRNAQVYPARDIAVGYHRRWDIELAFAESKTRLHGVTTGTLHTVFRSHKPVGVYQEAWGMLATYNLIRSLMAEAGAIHGVPPLEISFVETLEVVRMALPTLQSCAPRIRRKLYDRMLRDIADCRLDRPRRKRWAPRVVKRKMSNFKLKHTYHRTVQHDAVAALRLVERETA